MGHRAIGVRIEKLGELPLQRSARQIEISDDQLVVRSARFRTFLGPAPESLGADPPRFLIKRPPAGGFAKTLAAPLAPEFKIGMAEFADRSHSRPPLKWP